MRPHHPSSAHPSPASTANKRCCFFRTSQQWLLLVTLVAIVMLLLLREDYGGPRSISNPAVVVQEGGRSNDGGDIVDADADADVKNLLIAEKLQNPIRQISILGERNSGTRWTFE